MLSGPFTWTCSVGCLVDIVILRRGKMVFLVGFFLSQVCVKFALERMGFDEVWPLEKGAKRYRGLCHEDVATLCSV